MKGEIHKNWYVMHYKRHISAAAFFDKLRKPEALATGRVQNAQTSGEWSDLLVVRFHLVYMPFQTILKWQLIDVPRWSRTRFSMSVFFAYRFLLSGDLI